MYIAQPTQVEPDIDTDDTGPDTNGPDTISDGNIYTCTNGMSFISPGSLYASCQTQLVVNGSLIAQQVRFLRTFGTLDNALPGEAPADFGTGAGGSAAEVINYTPEMYLGPTPLKQPFDGPANSTVDDYDSIISMPPVY